jgi:hypothetical protein
MWIFLLIALKWAASKSFLIYSLFAKNSHGSECIPCDKKAGWSVEDTSELETACGRTHPVGKEPMIWKQLSEYATGHWLQKAGHRVGSL